AGGVPRGLQPERAYRAGVCDTPDETGKFGALELFLLGLLRSQDFPLTSALKLADRRVLVLIACVLSLVLLIAAAGPRKRDAFVVIGAFEIRAAPLLPDGFRLFWNLGGYGLGK